MLFIWGKNNMGGILLKRVKVSIYLCMIALLVAGCGKTEDVNTPSSSTKVTIDVVTSFAGNDGNAQNYKAACKEWEQLSGNTINDMSANADDSFRQKISMDFATGSEPDVLFYFTGEDARAFIEAGKVVSVERIRKEYPEYAIDIVESKSISSNPAGPEDPIVLIDETYAVPLIAYWEAMFVNKDVLNMAGVEIPGKSYTWEQFLADCEKIKDAGYVPIAAALGDIPNYWWEYSIFNHTGRENHQIIPKSIEDEVGQAWIAGLEDIKALYESGYFPADTNAAKDEETLAMFLNGEAAFLLDGSWRVNVIAQACCESKSDLSTLDEEKLKSFGVTYVPGTESRKATDLIGGVSMGYYITQKAWSDAKKRGAAVSFVTYMISEEVASRFTKNATTLSGDLNDSHEDINSLERAAHEMLAGATSFTEAVQDKLDEATRSTTFSGMPQIVTGKMEVEQAVKNGLDIYYSR